MKNIWAKSPTVARINDSSKDCVNGMSALKYSYPLSLADLLFAIEIEIKHESTLKFNFYFDGK